VEAVKVDGAFLCTKNYKKMDVMVTSYFESNDQIKIAFGKNYVIIDVNNQSIRMTFEEFNEFVKLLKFLQPIEIV
jgi:hypothetical protein